MYKGSVWMCALIFCVAVALPRVILAQDKGGIMLGVGHIYPELELKTLHDDNLLRAPGRELETWVGIISPKVTYEIASHKNRFIAEYLLEAGFHENSSIDDYVDNRLRAEYEYTPTSRIFAAVRSEYFDTHDSRGEFRTEGATATVVEAEPDEWHHWAIEGNAAYGAKSAKGRIEADLGYLDKTYDNNRAVTFVRDRDNTYGAARLFYRIRPKTNVVLEARATKFNYDRDAPGSASLDSLGTTILAGVTWEATFKTTGFAKIGFVDKDFDSSRRADDDDIAWEAGVEWRPRTYSIFTLETSSGHLETNGTGDFISHDEIKFGWRHDWRTRISTQVDFTYAEESFDDITSREDEIINAGGHVYYEMRRWLNLGAGYRYDERDSSTNLFDYDRNLFELLVNITL